uniref:Probable ATP-dependent RNA helicase DDX52 n=1 Tax=Acrobeloides nanus TaxID=290746 RepID=A0A914ELT9_9BILA
MDSKNNNWSYKDLLFGVKRTSTKPNLIKLEQDPNNVRLRVLPTEIPLKKRKILTEKIDNEDVTILSGSNLTLNNAKKKKQQQENQKDEEVLEKAQYEKIQHLKKLNRIYTWGEDIPNPFIEFSELKLPEVLMNNLTTFQIKEPTPIQMQSIPILLAKRDLLACAPTGSGKTLAFILPVVLNYLKLKKSFQGRLFAIVLEPTRVLARQTYMNFVKTCHNLPITCAFLDDNRFPEKANIIISSPKRLIFSWNQPDFDKTRLKSLRWLIVDESDRLFDHSDSSGQNFKDQLDAIIHECNGKFLKLAFFSATFSYELEDWCKNKLNDLATVCIGSRNSANSSVIQQLIFTGDEHGKITALRTLIDSRLDPPALIFTGTKERAGQLFAELSSLFKNRPIQLMSSDLTDRERDTLVEQFRSGQIWILICTEMLGRGVDFSGVNMVVNFDLPTSVVEYIHRVGRTGRAGRKGFAITYFTEQDMNIVRPIATVIHQAGFEVPEYTLTLNKVSKKSKKKMKKFAPKRSTFGSVLKWEKIKKVKVKKHELKPSVLKRKVVEKSDANNLVKKKKRIKMPKKL